MDDILSMSWDQIQICSRSVLRHKVSMLNMVLEPLSNALGSKYNKGKVSRKRATTNMTREQKDADRLRKLQQLGILD